jgi:hypothetical protein
LPSDDTRFARLSLCFAAAATAAQAAAQAAAAPSAESAAAAGAREQLRARAKELVPDMRFAGLASHRAWAT